MLLYIFVAVWPLIVQYIYKYRPLCVGKNKINKNKYIILSLIPIFFILAFRGGTMGADTSTYIRQFSNSINTPLESIIANSRMEIGYLIFVKLITYITHNPLVYQVICVSFMIYGLYCFLKELETEDALLFVYFYCTLGVFFFMFTGTRQCLAMGICLFSYKFLKQNKYLQFLLCSLLAFYFHKSSVLFITVLFIYNKKVNIINIVIYIIFAFLIGRNLESVQQWFNDTLDYTYSLEYTGNGMIFLIVLLALSIFSMIMIYNRYGGFNINKNTRILMNINFITIVFWLMRLQTRIAERPSYYFIFFSCAFYANALNSIKNNRDRRLYKIIIFSLAMILYIYRLITNFSILIPFEFY